MKGAKGMAAQRPCEHRRPAFFHPMKLLIVPARTGLQWVQLGIRTFRQQPLALAALFFLSMAAMSLVSLLPLVGPAIALGLLPATSLAMMVAAAEASHGRAPTPALLLVAFRTGRQRLNSMLVLGALYAAGFLLVIGLSMLIDDGQFANVYLGGEPLTREIAESPDFQAAMWLSMGLYLPLSLLFWHAPGLVHWHNVPPVKALFFSIVACVRNIGALLVFGLGWMGVFIAAGMVMALFTSLLAQFIGGIASGLMVATAMLLAAMFFTSIVFTFRDCFAAPDASDGRDAIGAEPPSP